MSTDTSTRSHTHSASLEACLDLINTVELTEGVPHDHIPTTEQVIVFLAAHDLAHEADLRRQQRREGEAWVARVRGARAALRELWDAQVEGRAPTSDALLSLNALLDHAPRVELRATLAGVEITHDHRDDDPTGEALARAAMPLVEAIATGQTDRFRICANDGCRWVFEDASRAGRRRWCDMSTCGNRAKVRRFRSRQREGPGDL
jgi:predicted RNA-binding Zn ribbon-like protein